MLHIITGLSTGGAEMALYKLLYTLKDADIEFMVVSLTDIGNIGRRIEDLGIPVYALGMHKGISDMFSILKLIRHMKRFRPDIIQTWMYHSDLIGGIAAKLADYDKVVWGIRHSNLSMKHNKATTMLVVKLCALLSHFIPKKIVCCSYASVNVHENIGYNSRLMLVIPNGFDVDRFKPNDKSRCVIRRELGIPLSSVLVGLIARFDPQKDHKNFIAAATTLCDIFSNVHFLLCGEEVTLKNKRLVSLIDNAGVENRNRFHLLGRRNDIPTIMTALDILVSSSLGEGFPNVVGEAMACGIPCVVTDVGDAAHIVGDFGIVVPPREHRLLAQALIDLLSVFPKAFDAIGSASRKRIISNVSLSKISDLYLDEYRKIAESS